jgi:chromosomal replication initiator protein
MTEHNDHQSPARDYLRVAKMPSAREKRIAIVRNVAREHGVRIDLILAPANTPGARLAHVVAARAKAMHLIRVLLGDSYPKIGAFFGRDHTTVIHHVKKWRAANGYLGNRQ